MWPIVEVMLSALAHLAGLTPQLLLAVLWSLTGSGA
jgi:hypothetical protein